MGPAELPARPKFHWDVKNPPWKDGKGSQEQYYNAVRLWKRFHDMLPESNGNKIPAALQGIVLQSQLYGRAVDLVNKISNDEVESEDGALKVASALHKQDVLSIATDTFHRFLDVLRTKQGENESYKNYETRFDSQVCRLNATCHGSELPSALLSFLLLANSRIDAAQRVSLLSAAAPIGAVRDATDRDGKDILSMLSYDDIASVVRACDEPNKPLQQYGKPMTAISSDIRQPRSAGKTSFRKTKQKKRLSPEELADLKSKSVCHACGQIGHWSTDVAKCKGSPSTLSGSKSTRKAQISDESSSTVVKPGTMKFNMVSLSPGSTIVTPPGRLVDDGAPYSGLGIVELRSLSPCLIPDWDGTLLPVPESVRPTPFWQYENGNHVSSKRKILGSVIFSAVSDQGSTVQVRHLVIDGSSQWVIGRNVTRICNLRHIGENCLEFKMPCGVTNTISMVDLGAHSYLPVEIFSPTDSSLCFSTFLTLACSVNSCSLKWHDTKRLLDKVHRHACGHSSYSDIKPLLERNGIWMNDCGKYLSSLLEGCPYCDAVKSAGGSRKVSLHSLSRGFNEVVCVDHLFPDRQDVLHIMDSQTRYSTGALVASTSMNDAIPVFDTEWMSEFWPPEAIQGDKAFHNQEFNDYLKVYDVKFRPVPPRRHNKNVLESKHRILRDMYLRLKSETPAEDPRLLVSKRFRISNDLYGNNIASAHELAKGYTRPITSGNIQKLPPEIRKAQEQLAAKRKLNLILSSKVVSEIPVRVGDYVQVYIKLPNQKRGKWSATKPVISFDPESRTVSVPGSKGRIIQAAIEDVRHAVADDVLGEEVQAAIDELSSELNDTIESGILDDDDTVDERTIPSAVTDIDDDFLNDSPLSSFEVPDLSSGVMVPMLPQVKDWKP